MRDIMDRLCMTRSLAAIVIRSVSCLLQRLDLFEWQVEGERITDPGPDKTKEEPYVRKRFFTRR